MRSKTCDLGNSLYSGGARSVLSCYYNKHNFPAHQLEAASLTAFDPSIFKTTSIKRRSFSSFYPKSQHQHLGKAWRKPASKPAPKPPQHQK